MKVLISVIGWIKPVLLIIFPYKFLKKIKGNMVKNSLTKLRQTPIEVFERSAYPDGINLVGNIMAETGLGQSCRLLASELEASDLQYSVFQYDQLGAMKNGKYSYEGRLDSKFPYNINLIHINPHELGLAFTQLYKKAWNKRYNIGFWLWELEEFPNEWMPCFECVDEIWTPSEFTSNSIRQKTKKPVITIPYHLDIKLEKEYCKKDFGLPEDKFLFLMMYDRTSTTERKNPKAAIQAFKMAFSEEKDVGLVIKISNSTQKELNEIGNMLKGYDNIYFITEILEREEVNGLISCIDAVVSLHRSEGFGLVIAEAMLVGTPVIATNWSANSEFMTSDTACLVDFELVLLDHDVGAFQKGNRWAEADVQQAASYMKMLYENPEYGRELALRARQHIRSYLSMEQAVSLIQNRVLEIYGGNIREKK